MAGYLAASFVGCAALVPGGCSRDLESVTIPEQPSWLLKYIAPADQQLDAADVLLELVHLSESGCGHEVDPQFFRALCHLGHARENSLRIVSERVPFDREPSYVLYAQDERVGGARISALIGCISDVLDRHQESSDTAPDQVAGCVLAAGWQLSKNGEDRLMALLRLALWDRAVDLLLASHQEDAVELLEQQKRIREQIHELRRSVMQRGEHR